MCVFIFLSYCASCFGCGVLQGKHQRDRGHEDTNLVKHYCESADDCRRCE